MAIVGGSKVSTKLNLLTNLLAKVDTLIVGGGIANTFLAAQGLPIGSSLFEADLIPVAKALWNKAEQTGKTILLPQDVVVADSIEAKQGTIKTCQAVATTDKIFDIGPLSQQQVEQQIRTAKTILWNGPIGVFETPAFARELSIWRKPLLTVTRIRLRVVETRLRRLNNLVLKQGSLTCQPAAVHFWKR